MVKALKENGISYTYNRVKDKIVKGYTSNLELNPNYKPTKDNSEDNEIVL